MPHTDAPPKFRLNALNSAIRLSIILLAEHRQTIVDFLDESQRMENVGPVLTPTLFLSQERRETEALLKPLYENALALLTSFDEQQAKQAAKVGAG
jgi:hypothetical protein